MEAQDEQEIVWALERRCADLKQKLREIQHRERHLTQNGSDATHSRLNQRLAQEQVAETLHGGEDGGHRISSAVVRVEEEEETNQGEGELRRERPERRDEDSRTKTDGNKRDYKRDHKRDEDHGEGTRRDRERERRARFQEESTMGVKRKREDNSSSQASKRSAVVVGGAAQQQRNRKMFGVLLGTLQRFKEQEETKSEKDILREQVEERVKTQVIEEHQQLVQEERHAIDKAKEEYLQQMETLTKEIAERHQQDLERAWEKQRELLANPQWHQTKTLPALFYTVNGTQPTPSSPDHAHDQNPQSEPRPSSSSPPASLPPTSPDRAV